MDLLYIATTDILHNYAEYRTGAQLFLEPAAETNYSRHQGNKLYNHVKIQRECNIITCSLLIVYIYHA